MPTTKNNILLLSILTLWSCATRSPINNDNSFASQSERTPAQVSENQKKIARDLIIKILESKQDRMKNLNDQQQITQAEREREMDRKQESKFNVVFKIDSIDLDSASSKTYQEQCFKQMVSSLLGRSKRLRAVRFYEDNEIRVSAAQTDKRKLYEYFTFTVRDQNREYYHGYSYVNYKAVNNVHSGPIYYCNNIYDDGYLFDSARLEDENGNIIYSSSCEKKSDTQIVDERCEAKQIER